MHPIQMLYKQVRSLCQIMHSSIAELPMMEARDIGSISMAFVLGIAIVLVLHNARSRFDLLWQWLKIDPSFLVGVRLLPIILLAILQH